MKRFGDGRRASLSSGGNTPSTRKTSFAEDNGDAKYAVPDFADRVDSQSSLKARKTKSKDFDFSFYRIWINKHRILDFCEFFV